MTFAQKIEPIFEELFWAFVDQYGKGDPEYSEKTLFFVTHLFTDILLSHMWQLQRKEKIAETDSGAMAIDAGMQISKLVKTFTNKDTHIIAQKYMNEIKSKNNETKIKRN